MKKALRVLTNKQNSGIIARGSYVLKWFLAQKKEAPLSNDIPDDSAYQRLVASLARRAAEADAADAPLFMLQQAEYGLIDAGRINPAAGEYLAAFRLINGALTYEVRKEGSQKPS